MLEFELAHYRALRVVWEELFEGHFGECPGGRWEELQSQQDRDMFNKAWDEFEKLQKHFEAASAAMPMRMMLKEDDTRFELRQRLRWQLGSIE